MANIGAHLWTMLMAIFIFIMAFMIWFWGFWSLQDNLASDNLTDAVRTATYLSRDGSARLERGSFVINTQKFQKTLDQTHIKAFNGHTLNNNEYHIQYLADNQPSEDVHGTDHNISNGSKSRNYNTSTPLMSRHDDNVYKTVRGVRVSVNYPARSKLVYGGHNQSYKGDRFSATEIVQTYGKNNDHDTHNDLTR